MKKLLKAIQEKLQNPAANSFVFYNTLHRKKELFEPLEDNIVKIYTCGPTVYSRPHIGNMRSFVFADTLHRALKYVGGYEIKHVINITDVGHLTDDADEGEDKVEKAAKEKKKSAKEIVEEMTNYFFQDLKALNVNTSEYLFPRATEYINAQIAIIKTLEEKGYTYRTSDGIYFDTSLFKDYGILGGIDKESLLEGARIGKNKEKKNPSDFALWKFSPKDKKRQQEWDSPWGKGFPGWHIECSAMLKELLGKQADIHTGGIDHIPVHHNNEIAQSACAIGNIPARFWMHVAFLNLKNEKMSKSKGNIITLEDLQNKGIEPLAFRYYLLTVHYRKEIKFSFEALEAAKKAYMKLGKFVSENYQKDAEFNKKYKKEFDKLVKDDLSLPEAVALSFDLIKDEKLSKEERVATLLEFDKVFGLDLLNFKDQDEFINIENLPEKVKTKIKEREEARKEKNFKLADKIRDELQLLGYELIDEKEGTKVKAKSR